MLYNAMNQNTMKQETDSYLLKTIINRQLPISSPFTIVSTRPVIRIGDLENLYYQRSYYNHTAINHIDHIYHMHSSHKPTDFQFAVLGQ